MKKQTNPPHPIKTNISCISTAAFCLALITLSATAGRAEDYYNGKSITLYVGSGVGGAYDRYGRMVARHISKNIPGNPSVIIKNVSSASGRTLAGFMYKVAPKDGTAIAIIQSTTPFDPVMGVQSQFDGRHFEWIGSASRETAACIVWHTSPVRTIEDVRKYEVVVGGSGPSSTDAIFPNLLNYLFGMKFKVIAAYKTFGDITLAIERGELNGRCGITVTSLAAINSDWIREGKIRLLTHFGTKAIEAFPQVPSVFDLAVNEEQRQILRVWTTPSQMGRPFFGPPGLPSDVLAILRKAFDETMRDPGYLAEAEKSKLATDSATGAEVASLVNDVYSMPRSILEKAAIGARHSP
jgi:tripartite-type tricarboxylate transporter receptor subunit TctC